MISKTKTKPNNKICIKSTSSHKNPTFPIILFDYIIFPYTTSIPSFLPFLSLSLSQLAMESDEECNTGLCLGLGMGGGGGHVVKKEKKQKLLNNPLVPCFDIAFELCPKGEAMNVHNHNKNMNNKVERLSLERHHQYYPNATSDSDNNNNNNNDDRRKKLRLTKEQSAMLESTFKLHNTLNPVQKKTLAEQLNLKTRQIEVWFQNRRARTKLKQTEVDYELLKKHCQNLSEENRRLKKELQELKVVGIQSPSLSPLCNNIQRPSKTTTVCSSCEKPFKRNEANLIN